MSSSVEAVRQRIGSLIIQTLVPVKMPLPVITLDGELEGLLAQAMRIAGDARHPIEPALCLPNHGRGDHMRPVR
jgi:flagellar biosynthesis protein FlhA